MKKENRGLVWTVDSNIFLSNLSPHSSRVTAKTIEASRQLIVSLDQREWKALVSVVVLMEIQWVLAREKVEGFEIFEASLLTQSGVTLREVDLEIARMAGQFRAKYYSKTNPFSYNDGIILATAVKNKTAGIITTDPHLLKASEIRALMPDEI